MFTGLVRSVGTVAGLSERGGGRCLKIDSRNLAAAVDEGSSIAVDGVCLTVETCDSEGFTVFVSPTTLGLSCLGERGPGERLNLELPVTAGAFMHGHIVSGHVDGTGRMEKCVPEGQSRVLTISAPSSLIRYLAPRGSICVDGISLTLVASDARGFSVTLNPRDAGGDHGGRLGGRKACQPRSRHAGALCRAAGQSRGRERLMAPVRIDPQTGRANLPFLPTAHCNERPGGRIELVVLHCISLPRGQYPDAGAPSHVDQLFCGELDSGAHPDFAGLGGEKVSAHFFIDRRGRGRQYVATGDRAWHAGVSSWRGRRDCNDFSLGIELEGTDDSDFEPQQYRMLGELLQGIRSLCPQLTRETVLGHSDIALPAGRKTDPGTGFDWTSIDRVFELPALRASRAAGSDA